MDLDSNKKNIDSLEIVKKEQDFLNKKSHDLFNL